MTATIEILPQTNAQTLCLRLTGTIDAEDFTQNFGQHVQNIAEKNGFYNLYILHDAAFKGWSRAAADLSFKNIGQFGAKARRLAYVNAPASRILMMKMLQPMMNAEVRYYNLSEKEEALAWVMEST